MLKRFTKKNVIIIERGVYFDVELFCACPFMDIRCVKTLAGYEPM